MAVNDLLDHDALAVYDEPFETLGLRFASVSYDGQTEQVHVVLKNRLQISFAREQLGVPVFSNATDEDMQVMEVSEISVYFPRIDEGFSLEPLAFGDFGNHPWDSKFIKTFQIEQEKRLTVA